MAEEKVVSLREFKVVMEGVDSKLQKIVEVMDHRFESLQTEMVAQFHEVNGKIHSLQQQVGLLHEGQTEIRAELRTGLKDKVSYSDFTKLEKRVARLERKTA